MYILGISAYYHDSAACLIHDGRIIAAVQEERFTRKKHDHSFPARSINFCVSEAAIDSSKIDQIVFYEKPFIKFERLLETYLAFAPNGFRSFATAMPLWIKNKLFQKQILLDQISNLLGPDIDWGDRLLFSDHHLSHAASAFYPSPFPRAAVLTLDAVGEWATTSLAIGNGKSLYVTKEIQFPHSLGLLYSAFTYYAGFKVNSGEYKLMGLAPYGTPQYADLIKETLIDVKDDGSFHIDVSYFDYCTGLTMTSTKFHDLFGGGPRAPGSALTQRDMDMAASIQIVVEETVVKLAKHIASETRETNLCLAGGVALNCVANGAVQRESIFQNIWIQPAAGDAGGALGAALAAWHIHNDKDRVIAGQRDLMTGAYLGPAYTEDQVGRVLDECKAVYRKLSKEEVIDQVASALADGKAVGWFHGRMEFGPRALGGRSIIADPRSPFMQRQLNLKIKQRESFRPFAPSVLEEHVSDWFELEGPSPYMLLVAELKEDKRVALGSEEQILAGLQKLDICRSIVPAVTHVDYTARVQTVTSDTNPEFYALIQRFYELTGCPLVVNTSFNVRGEPIVCGPEDAFRCFIGTQLDVLSIENFFLVKEEQTQTSDGNYSSNYVLD